jgi:hypothetical protein
MAVVDARSGGRFTSRKGRGHHNVRHSPMDSAMTDLERLLAVEEIKKLKARYFRGVDGKNWDLFASVFAEDAACDYRGAATDPATVTNAVPESTGDTLNGIKRIVAVVMKVTTGVISIHQGFMPEIDITSDRTAKGIWVVQDRLKFPPGGPIAEMVGYGHYHETYECVGNEWKIKTLKVTRIRVDNILAEVR